MKRGTAETLVIVGSSVALGCVFGFMLMRNQKVRSTLVGGIQKLADMPFMNDELVSEESMLRKAKLTGDPRVNQQWVEGQWNSL